MELRIRGATKFPLHTAVKQNNQDMIATMLIVGAQRNVRNSNDQTPSDLAASLNMNGSHDLALAMLLGEQQCLQMGLQQERAVVLTLFRCMASSLRGPGAASFLALSEVSNAKAYCSSDKSMINGEWWHRLYA
jgi:hypothetical protein